MVNAFEISPLLAEQATRPTATQRVSGPPTVSPADQFAMIVITLGLLALGLWLVRRLTHGRKLLLHDAPGRPNHLGWIHIVVIAGWLLADRGMALAASLRDQTLESVTSEVLVGAVVLQMAMLAIALGAAHVGFRRGIVRGMGLSTRRWFIDIARGLLAGLAVFPVCMVLARLSEVLIPETFQEAHGVLVFLNEDASLSGKLLAVTLAVLVAPVVEEVLYRGILQTALRRVLGGPWAGILVAGGIFTIAHLEFAGDPTRPVGLQAFAPLFALAVVLGYNYERTGRLLPSIITHCFFNAVNVVVALLPGGAP
ncbi:MAG: CPBP family intramembrane glutamic endopeptidase [Planctomycetota bacterium]